MKRPGTTLEWESSDELPQDLFFRSDRDPPPSAPSIPDTDTVEKTSRGRSMVRHCAGIGLWSALLTAMVFMILWNQAAVEKRVRHEETVVQIQRTIDIQQRQSIGRGQATQPDPVDDSTLSTWQTECLREISHISDTGAQELDALQVTQIEFCGEQVLADLFDEATGMRVTRAYGQQGGRWLRTMPASDCWGPASIIESDYFRFMVQERDVQAVEEAMGAIDRLYLDMREQIGLAPPPSQNVDRHLIVVDILRLTADILIHEPDETAIAIHLPSPSLVVSPAHLDEPEVLLHTAAAPIAELAVSDKLCADIHTNACDGYPRSLVEGLTLWLQWQGSDLISWTPDRLNYADSWQTHLAQYGAPPFYRLEHMATVDPKFWLQESTEATQERDCGPQDDNCRRYQETSALVQHGYLLSPYVTALVAESMIEWLVTERGADVIPEIADAIDNYDSFPAAIETISGMPVDQAQSEWHAHLAGWSSTRSNQTETKIAANSE